jgi:hypothetical protein
MERSRRLKVLVTAAWCDVCYEIEKHKGPNRMKGAWYFNAPSWEEQTLANGENDYHEKLRGLLSSLKTERSALVVELQGGVGVDFFVQANGKLSLEYADQSAEVFAREEVDKREASIALEAIISRGDFQREMEKAGIALEYCIE